METPGASGRSVGGLRPDRPPGGGGPDRRSGCSGCPSLRRADPRVAGRRSWPSRAACSPSWRSTRWPRPCELQAGAARRARRARAGARWGWPPATWACRGWPSGFSRARPPSGVAGAAPGARPGDMVAIGHRPAQPGRGPRDRLVVRRRRAGARHVPDRGLHGPQRHRGARHRGPGRRGAAAWASGGWRPGPGGRRAGHRRRLDRRVPDQRGAGGAVLLASPSGAALQVVVEVGRYIARRAPGGLGSGWVVGGFLAGVAVMYLTGLLAG